MSLASPDELSSLTSINDVREWAGLERNVWDEVDLVLGKCPTMRVLAFIQEAAFERSIAAVRVRDSSGLRSLTEVEATQARLMWRIARVKFGIREPDPASTALASEPVRPSPAVVQAEQSTSHVEPPAASKPPQTGFARAATPPKTTIPSTMPGGTMPGVPGVTKPIFKPAARSTPAPQDRPTGGPKTHQLYGVPDANFYNIHRTRGLHLGPRFRSVKTVWGCPGSAYAILDPRRPVQKEKIEPPERSKTPGKRRVANTAEYPNMNTAATQEALPVASSGGNHEIVPRELGLGSKLHIPQLAAQLKSTTPIASLQLEPTWGDTVEDDPEPFADEPWVKWATVYHPSMYDGALTSLFLAANPVPGGTPDQLPIPWYVEDFRMTPHIQSGPYISRAHPQEGALGRVNHYFDITGKDGVICKIDGFDARAVREQAEAQKTGVMAGSARSFGKQADVDIYRYQSFTNKTATGTRRRGRARQIRANRGSRSPTSSYSPDSSSRTAARAVPRIPGYRPSSQSRQKDSAPKPSSSME